LQGAFQPHLLVSAAIYRLTASDRGRFTVHHGQLSATDDKTREPNGRLRRRVCRLIFTAMTLRDDMPAVYRSFLPELFDRAAPEEKRATCSDCAMCDKSGRGKADDPAFFQPDIKCCSYHPTLPNYLVGAALADASLLEGGARLRAKIAARVGVTPLWVSSPRKWLVVYDAARDSSFGRSERLLCPYFERGSGSCTVWPYRESICATFFCKHTAGSAGRELWMSLKRYLAHLESRLSWHAATVVLGYEPRPDPPRMKLTLEDLEDRAPSEADYVSYWGDFVGREEAFYVACAKTVEALTVNDRRRLIDETGGDKLLAEMTALYEAATQPQLAPRLQLNPELRVTKTDTGVGVIGYSKYDPLVLTQDLYDALALFRADETTEDALLRLRRDHDLDLPESLLLEMQLHEVMTAPKE
jgi:hypothetical protein